ncbi:MAG: efflux RND transporter permease subunit [Halioglobus sp.]|nr:efflux RND transporter permease subunit [Halioglobus sp.]
MPALNDSAREVLRRARESGQFIFIQQDLQLDKPQVSIRIDRDKAALLGVDMQTLSTDLSALLSGGYVNRFAMNDRSYRVVPQIRRQQRLVPSDLRQYHTRTRSGELIPLSTLVEPGKEVVPAPQRLPAAQRGHPERYSPARYCAGGSPGDP